MGVVDAKPVAVGVTVGEQPRLEHAVWGWPDAGHHLRGIEGGLFRVGEVILRQLVEGHLSHLHEGVVPVGPDLGEIEGIEAVIRSVFLRHDLNAQRPAGELAVFDGIVEILEQERRLLATDFRRLFGGEALDALVRLEVEFHPIPLAFGVDQHEGVGAESVHAAIRGRDAAIPEEHGELVRGLGRVGEEIPDIVRLLAVGIGIVFLGVDEVRELDAVLDEEDGRVVAHQVPVAFLGVELHGKAPRIPRGVGGALRSGHGGEADEEGRLLALGREELGLGVLRDIRVCDFEFPVGARAYRVDDALGDALPVEARQLLDEVEVLE